MKKLHLKRPERLVFFIIMIGFVFLGMFGVQKTSYGESVPKYITIKVSQGDTLWTLAKDYVKEDEDIRDVIANIKELNNLKSSNIKIGQELVIKV